MTTQHYFDEFLQVGDEVQMVSFHPELRGTLYKQGIVSTIEYETGTCTVDVEGNAYICTPQDFEPITFRKEPRKRGVIIELQMPREAAERLKRLYDQRNPELMQLLRELNIRSIGTPREVE